MGDAEYMIENGLDPFTHTDSAGNYQQYDGINPLYEDDSHHQSDIVANYKNAHYVDDHGYSLSELVDYVHSNVHWSDIMEDIEHEVERTGTLCTHSSNCVASFINRGLGTAK